MEAIQEKKVEKVETVETVEVPKDLIINMKNMIEVVNGRINWKTSELLPMGLLCKQLDEIIEKLKKNNSL